MRGDIIHRVYGVHAGRDEDSHFGTYCTVGEAEAAIARLRETHGRDWEERYHNRGFVIREAVVETDFPNPRTTEGRATNMSPWAPRNRMSQARGTRRPFVSFAEDPQRESWCLSANSNAITPSCTRSSLFRKGGRDFAADLS